MLALVWATKQCRCYLFGREFLARTDHFALTYLRYFADNNSRLMRLSLRLSEFDFIIEHKPGTSIRHADAWSRHVGVVREDGHPSKEKILAEQSKDHFCNAQKPKIRTSKSEYFLDDDGVMYKRSREHQHQLVVPKALVQDIIKAVYIGHQGMKRTFDLISLRYWWPSMRQSIERYVKSCDPCQRRKENREFVAPLGNTEKPSVPFQVTHIDVTGPYPVTQRGNKFLLTFIDGFSKYVEAFAMVDQTGESWARIYESQIVTRHGSGSTLITDQGRSFVSAFFKETCRILGIRKVNTTSFHPASNGMVERFHRSLHSRSLPLEWFCKH